MIEIEEIPVENIDEFWKIHIKYPVEDGIVMDEWGMPLFVKR